MTDPYEKSESMFAHTSVPWQQRVIVDFMRQLAHGGPGICLDVGSGIGNNVGALLGHCKMIHTTDVSEWALDVLRRRYAHAGGRLVAQKMDAAALNYPDGTFDLVVCTEVLEHCPEPEHVLNECVRVLKPGGFLIVSGPNYLNLAGALKKFHERVYPRKTWDAWGNHGDGRENFTTAPKLRAWVVAAGLRIESARGGDLVRGWFPFLRQHYEIIDRHPFLGAGRWWPLNLFMMSYFILASKPSSRR